MSSVDSLSSATAQIMDHIDLGPTGSLSLEYAKLQLAQSEIAKNQANDMMDKIQANQAEQQKVADMIEEARTLQNKAEDTNGCTTMSAEMEAFMKENDIPIESTGKKDNGEADNLHNKDEWEYNIQSLMNYQETLSTSTQTDMVLLQDYMAQYNSYIQGASKAINDATQTLQSVITR